MSTALAHTYPQVKNLYAEASSVLGYDLWKLVSEGPEDELNSTAKTQPALLTAGVAVWNVWRENNGPLPVVMAGHSLGEYTALVCSGSIDFTDAVSLVADRGTYMQSAVPQGTGTMAAILGLTDQQVIEICRECANGEIVSPANFNTPGQVVIAGNTSAVNRAVEAATRAGAKRSIILPVSVPSHCELMRQAAEKFSVRINNIKFKTPQIPVIHNVDVSSKPEPDNIRQALVMQLYSPVRWVETVETMVKSGITTIVECGPGKVLSGLIKRIDRNIETLPVYDPDTVDKARFSFSS